MKESLYDWIEMLATEGSRLHQGHRDIIRTRIDDAIRSIIRDEIEADRDRRVPTEPPHALPSS